MTEIQTIARRQPQRQRDSDHRPPKREAEVIELGQTVATRVAAVEVRHDLGSVTSAQAAGGVGAQVVDAVMTIRRGVVANVRLHVVLPQARPGPDGQLGHVVGAGAQDHCYIARRQALYFHHPKHGAPTFRQIPECLPDQGGVLARQY
jgi:hypothetical protein